MKHEEISYHTKKQLADALKTAMKHKPLNKITVSDLVRACGMNRKTFYYHFTDIYDLLRWIFDEEAVEVVKKFDLMIDYEEAINFIIDYIEQNDYMISCAYDAVGRDVLKRFFRKDFLGMIGNVIESAEELKGRKLNAEYRKYLELFYTESLVGMILDWITERDKRDRETVIKFIYCSMKDSLIGILSSKEETLFERNNSAGG